MSSHRPCRGWLAACVAALLAGGLQVALAAPIACQAGTESVPLLDPEAGAAELGRITLDCGGAQASAPALDAVRSISLNAAVLPTYTPWVSMGHQQIAGSILPSGAIAFRLALEPSGADLVVHNLWVDPGAQAPGFDYTALLFMQGALVENPQQWVGRVGEPADDAGDAGQVPEPSSVLLALMALVIGNRMLQVRSRHMRVAVRSCP